jgi:hypothetical protein
VWVYGQTEVQKDLVAARTTEGQQALYDSSEVHLHDVETETDGMTQLSHPMGIALSMAVPTSTVVSVSMSAPRPTQTLSASRQCSAVGHCDAVRREPEGGTGRVSAHSGSVRRAFDATRTTGPARAGIPDSRA